MQTETGSRSALRGSGGRRHEVHGIGRHFDRAMRILSRKAVLLVACLLQAISPPRPMAPALIAGATMKSNPLLLLGPRIRQGLGEAGDGEIRRCGAIDDRRNDAGRQEGERSQQADVPFPLGLTLGDLGEGANGADPDVVDPSPGPWRLRRAERPDFQVSSPVRCRANEQCPSSDQSRLSKIR